MKKIFKLLLLLNAILSLLAVCPDRPKVPSSSITDGLLITSASTGMSNSATAKVVSLTMFITPDQACAAGSVFNLFYMSLVQTESAIKHTMAIYIDCDTLAITFESTLFTTKTIASAFSSSNLGPVAINFIVGLANRNMRAEIQTNSYHGQTNTLLTTNSAQYDSSSKFYFCAGQDGASPNACTISQLTFDYRYFGLGSYPTAFLDGSNPAIAATYPLLGGSLASSIGSAASAYFGDDKSSPTPGTSPSWDSSNNFVTLTAGQFITFPLPDISSSIPLVSTSFSFVAWVKISSVAAVPTTVFSMHSADGTQVGYILKLDQYRNPSVSFGSTALQTNGMGNLALDQWQLVGFSAYISTDKKTTEGSFFIGSSYYALYLQNSASQLDISAASVIRIGGTTNSFSGQVSLVRIMTPGGGNIKTQSLCSSENSLELGAGSFALTCSGTNSLSLKDNKCYASCPSGSSSLTPFTGAPTPLCITCSDTKCKTCDVSGVCSACEDGYKLTSDNKCASKTTTSTTTTTATEKSKSGLTAGAIAGIACGGAVVLAVTGWLIYSLKIKKSLANKNSRKVVALESPSSTVVFVKSPASPINVEAKRLIL